MKKMLFVDACVRSELSRTKRLCEAFMEEFQGTHDDLEIERVVLSKETVEPMTAETLKERNRYLNEKDYNRPMFNMARQFQEADYVVIGAPYWDLSFPSVLKTYIENIMVSGLTFEATEKGMQGLCNAERMFYITTAGGFIGEKNFGYDYMCGIADMMGIRDVDLIKAEALDVDGFDPEKIVAKAIKEIKEKY